jgi:hypothetical protein
MALVDPNIALSYRGLQLQDPLDQYSKASAAQLNALKMDELMQEREALSQIRSAITAKGGPPDLEAAAQAMVSTGRPQFVQSGMAILEKLQNQKNYEQYRRDIEGAPAPANALAPVAATTETPPANALVAPRAAAAAAAAPVVSPQTQELMNRIRRVSQLGEVGKPEAAILKMQLENQLRAEAAENASPSDLIMMKRLGFELTKEGLRQYRAAQSTPPPPQPLVPVLENGKPVLRTREQAAGQTPFTPATVQIMGLGPAKAPKESEAPKPPSGYRFTPSGDLEPIPGGPAAPGLSNKDIQKREAVFPQATQAVKGFESKSDLFIKDLERLRDDPGLNQITGPIYGRTPSVSQAGSRAQALYDKIFAKGGFQALQDMREASKTGGALGNVSNEEGRRLEKSIVGGLDRTQNIKDVRNNINELIQEIRTSKSRVREAYDSTYEYRTQQEAAPSGAKSTGGWSVVR